MDFGEDTIHLVFAMLIIGSRLEITMTNGHAVDIIYSMYATMCPHEDQLDWLEGFLSMPDDERSGAIYDWLATPSWERG